MELLHGYVGYDEGGKLTEAVRRKNYCVVLFDEIEKANNDVLDIFLQILEDGVLTDSRGGKKVNFKNTIIIMTSNVGAHLLDRREKEIGFKNNLGKNEKITSDVRKDILKEVNKTFKNEFLNRIDEIIVFNKLSKQDIREIIEKYIFDLVKRFEKSSYYINISKDVTNYILENSNEEQNGARDIKRNIKNLIENKIVEKIINNNVKKESIINVYLDDKNNLIVD